jgi:hypothetical protein
MRSPSAAKKVAAFLVAVFGMQAQVYSPKLLRNGQPDATDLACLARSICKQSHAETPRQKAEAIWRYFLTDGRFVQPGFFYHIAGWSYEEPQGEVLDPIKLLNSYGFGLCYHIAPLLQSIYHAAGFLDARVWFLTGHTVAEVFFDGHYHYFDSDMMGYNVAGDDGFRQKPVSSVHDIERDGSIITGKLLPSGHVKPGSVDNPWYPADVRAHAIPELAALFTTTNDNRLYPFTRYAQGGRMDFVLRKGEKITRFFAPEHSQLYYLPYKFDGRSWTEFPQDSAEFHISTSDGPRSQKDDRTWATGRIDYEPAIDSQAPDIVIEMPSPYVIIDAQFTAIVRLVTGSKFSVETSTDNGAHWTASTALSGPYAALWHGEPATYVRSAHGRLTAVSGTYGYRVRLRKQGEGEISNLHITTRFQLNPRSLPYVQNGENLFHFTAEPAVERIEFTPDALHVDANGLQVAEEKGQKITYPKGAHTGAKTYLLEDDVHGISGFDAGVRFLDMPDGRAPDKLTAEVRNSAIRTKPGKAGVAWSTSPNGPFHDLWVYNPQPKWLDKEPISRLLRWPEVFHHVDALPPDTKRVYIKIYTSGPAFDNVRFALYRHAAAASGAIVVLQKWHQGDVAREHSAIFPASTRAADIVFHAADVTTNDAIAFACR